MLTVQVTFIVQQNRIQDFIDITRFNVENSRNEQGIRTFSFYRKAGSENVFVLFEAYNTKQDQEFHRETEHFRIWKKAVSDLLEKPYEIQVLENIE